MKFLSHRRRLPRPGATAPAACVAFALLMISAVPGRADEPDSPSTTTWQGTWKNNKYKTTGPLKCVARPSGDKQWEATFTGKFMGDPFEYRITFESSPQRDRTLIGGKAMLDGDGYQWQGFIRGKALYGQFRSLKGHNGQFALQQTE